MKDNFATKNVADSFSIIQENYSILEQEELQYINFTNNSAISNYLMITGGDYLYRATFYYSYDCVCWYYLNDIEDVKHDKYNQIYMPPYSTVYLKSSGDFSRINGGEYGYRKFSTKYETPIYCHGNIMSLLQENIKPSSTAKENEDVFKSLFGGFTNLLSTPLIPYVLGKNSFKNTFYGCTSLKEYRIQAEDLGGSDLQIVGDDKGIIYCKESLNIDIPNNWKRFNIY